MDCDLRESGRHPGGRGRAAAGRGLEPLRPARPSGDTPEGHEAAATLMPEEGRAEPCPAHGNRLPPRSRDAPVPGRPGKRLCKGSGGGSQGSWVHLRPRVAGPARKPPQRFPALARILGTKPHSCGLSPSLQTETPKGSGAVVGGCFPSLPASGGSRQPGLASTSLPSRPLNPQGWLFSVCPCVSFSVSHMRTPVTGFRVPSLAGGPPLHPYPDYPAETLFQIRSPVKVPDGHERRGDLLNPLRSPRVPEGRRLRLGTLGGGGPRHKGSVRDPSSPGCPLWIPLCDTRR